MQFYATLDIIKIQVDRLGEIVFWLFFPFEFASCPLQNSYYKSLCISTNETFEQTLLFG